MNKKKIRCYRVFAQVTHDTYNYPIYLLSYEGGSNFTLETCINCGELFVIDWENPETSGLNIKEIASTSRCPTCGSLLKDSIRDYPKTVKLSKNGEIGSYIPGNIIPPDNESLIKEFFEILPQSR